MLRTLAQLVNRRSCGPRLPLRPMLRLAALTEDVCNRLKIKPPLYRRRMDFYTNDAAFDSSRARLVLGWQPKVTLREGLARTLRAHVQPAATSLRAYWWIGKLLVLANEALQPLTQGAMLLA
jgi:hypothetical protein